MTTREEAELAYQKVDTEYARLKRAISDGTAGPNIEQRLEQVGRARQAAMNELDKYDA